MIDASKLGRTKASVVSDLEILHAEKRRLQDQLNYVALLIKATQDRCDHERKVSYCYAADAETHCPDCGATW